MSNCSACGWRRSNSYAPIRVSSRKSRMKITSMGSGASSGSIVLDVLEALIFVRRALERPTLLSRLPLHHLLDLRSQRKVLVGDALRSVGHQLHDHERVGHREIRVMPGGLRKVADRVHHHERRFPSRGAILAPNPAVLEIPVWQLGGEALLHLVFAVGLFCLLCHRSPPSTRAAQAL